ncbi:MAG: pyridoxal phosphate-dependent aminotransferase, partial [Planktomarina sp.]
VQDRTGVKTTRDNVLITPGGQSALYAAHMVTCDAGDTALYLDPFYATYPGTIRGVSCTPRRIATRAEDAFQPRRNDIAAQAAGAKSLLINSPNNPTGVVYTRDTVEMLADVAKRHDLWLISDEVYDSQIWEGAHLSPRQLPDMAERTLVIGSMSKSHAMTGSRVGWVCGPEAVIENLINLSTHTTYGVPGYIQDAALFALNEGAPLEEDVGAPFRRRRDIALRLLSVQNMVQHVPSGGAMYMMLDIRATGLSGLEFANALLDEEKIAVMPGESFGSAAAGHVRVALTVADDAFESAFQTVLNFASALVAN